MTKIIKILIASLAASAILCVIAILANFLAQNPLGLIYLGGVGVFILLTKNIYDKLNK